MTIDLDLDHFRTHGFAIMPQAIPTPQREVALRRINASIGKGSDEDVATLRARSWCPELRSDPAILDLFTSAIPGVDALIGRGRFKLPKSAQIALRFPVDATQEQATPTPHIDGRPLGRSFNGITTYENFTLLVGVLLSDVTQPNTGNLMVWPGTHQRYGQFFAEYGTEGIARGEMPPVELPAPQHILGSAGDVIFAHYQLGHAVALHRGPHIRYAVYFRISHVDHKARIWDCLTNVWLDYEGLAAS